MINTTTHLPKELLSEQQDDSSILWLPHTKLHSIGDNIDWASGLLVSKLEHSNQLKWSQDIKSIISQENLPLDEHIKQKENTPLLFTLPPGFKSKLALIVPSCSWKSPKKVYDFHASITKGLSVSNIQSLYIWKDPISDQFKGVKWIKV